MLIFRTPISIGALAVCLSLAGPALAQDEAAVAESGAPAGFAEGDIIVTAQRRAQSLQDVPISVSVVSGRELAATGVRTLEDLTARLPNVKISPTPGTDQLFIRGVGSGINLGFEQAVATFVDGVYRGRARASRVAFFDIDRVEVLRGPQTTFFGNNAIAGALNITTKKPGKEFSYDARALYAPSDGEYTLEGGVSVPLTNTFSVRLAGSASGMDGFIKNRRLDNKGPDLNTRIGRVALHWVPDSVFTVDARLDRGRVRDKGIFNAELRNCPPDAAFGAPRGACARFIAREGADLDDRLNRSTDVGPSRFDLDYTEAVATIAAEIGGHRLTSTSSYYTHDYYYYADVLPGAANASAVGTLSGLPTRSAEDFKQYSQELRFESMGRQTIEYMAGLYYAHGHFDAPNASGYYFAPFGAFTGGLLPAGAPIELEQVNRQTDDLMSIFGSATVNLSDELRVNLGARYSMVDKEAHRVSRIGTGDNALSEAGFTPAPEAAQTILFPLTGTSRGDYAQPRRTDRKFMPSVQVQYNVTDDVMAYASYTKGFKAGGYAVGASNASFAPETVDAYEAGIKSQLLDRRLTLNLTAFYSRYKNLQEAIIVINAAGTPVQTIANAARSVAKGIEAGGSFTPVDGLTFTFDAAYLSSKYKSYLDAPCGSLQNLTIPQCTQDLSGLGRAFAPKWSGNLGARYVQPVGDALQAEIGGNAYLTSGYFEDTSRDPLLYQSGYTKIDARIGIGRQDGGWAISIIGKNLTDKLTASVRRPLPSSPGAYLALPERPRSIALQLTMRN